MCRLSKSRRRSGHEFHQSEHEDEVPALPKGHRKRYAQWLRGMRSREAHHERQDCEVVAVQIVKLEKSA